MFTLLALTQRAPLAYLTIFLESVPDLEGRNKDRNNFYAHTSSFFLPLIKCRIIGLMAYILKEVAQDKLLEHCFLS
jgi:uncharacterized membrane protein YraQ (UPF0718 family)